MATNYPVNQNTDRDKSDEAGIGVDQIDAENVVPAKSKTKANKPREKVGSYTQLLRQHQRKSPREMQDDQEERKKSTKPVKKKVFEMIVESTQRTAENQASSEKTAVSVTEKNPSSALSNDVSNPSTEKSQDISSFTREVESHGGENDQDVAVRSQQIRKKTGRKSPKNSKEKGQDSGRLKQNLQGNEDLGESQGEEKSKGKEMMVEEKPNRVNSGRGKKNEKKGEDVASGTENVEDETGNIKKKRNKDRKSQKETKNRPISGNDSESRNTETKNETSSSSRSGSSQSGRGKGAPGGSTEESMEARGNNSQRKNKGKQNTRGQQQNNKGQSSKFQTLFQPYWSAADVSAGLKRGELIQGQFRINVKNYEECFIDHPDGTKDILIFGTKDRNRAFHGDIVAVQIKDKMEWRVLEKHLSNLDEEHRQKNGVENVASTTGEGATGNSSIEDKDTGKSESQKNTPRKKYLSVQGALSSSPAVKSLFCSGTEEKNDTLENKLLQPTARVVAILEKRNNRACTGNISLMTDKNPNWAFFKPVDSRMPRMRIPMSECPKDFFQRPDDYKNTLYICRIVDWKDNMQAFGSLMKSLGEAGEIEPETEGMLIENGVDFSEFPQEAIDSLPVQELPWKIPAEEYEYRRDFRSQCVFTIDPITARDLDDALSCELLPDGNFEVGVHIADVSYFLKEGTLLDKIAGQRATSVYLVQKVIPMLPRILCEELCSLNPDEDRLTFSVVWKMSEKGEIYEEWFGRSVIKSCCKLAYEHAQGFIEQPDKDWRVEELPPISEKFSAEQIKEKTLNLHKIAVNLRKNRAESGALRLDQVKLQFSLNDETKLPNGYSIYKQKDSNRLVEEFMLLANMAVAHKTYKTYPKKALLRRHPPPKSKMMEDLNELCQSLGVPLDVSSAGSLQRSLLNYYGNDEYSTARMQVLVSMCSKPMQNALYFCTGCLEDEEMYRHYALNVPLYTHFTSPIRRFADVVVHRTLAAVLGYSPEIKLSPQEINKQALQCNEKKTNSKQVQELSVDLYFSVFVKETGPFEEKAMVMGVLDKAFDIFIMKFGVIKRVYLDKLDIKDKIFVKEQNQSVLSLIWNPEVEGGDLVKEQIAIFSLVDCVMSAGDLPLQWKATIKPPHRRKKQTEADLNAQMDNLDLS
ncbi:DIS3-like exonuclease 2 isoform X1 [Crassostrea virginica]